MFQHMLDRVSENPQVWNILRRVVEDGFRGEKEVIARELAPFSDVGRREFLDFGCGTGEFAPCFPAAHYTGIDLSLPYLSYAGRTYAGRFVALSVAAMPFAPARFDAALVLGVLHHLPDDLARSAVSELHRVLRPGACVLVMEDIPPPDAWNIAGHAMHWLDRGGFIRSDADYRALFGAGFAVERMYTMRSGICDYGVYVLRRDERTVIDQ
jgi:SAM-dependent methyltransferase